MTMDNRVPGHREDGDDLCRKPYRKPEILSVERLEVLALDCSADGKNPPGTGPFDPCAQQPQS